MRLRRDILTVLLAATLACTWASPVRAQLTPQQVREGAWNASLGPVQSVARYTGRPVLILFAEDWCGYCEALEKVLAHPELRDVTRQFLLLKLLPDENPELMEQYGVTSHHQIVMLDWSGRVAGALKEYETAQEVALAVISAAAANDKFAGDKLLDLGYCAKAADRYNAVLKIAREAKLKDACQQKLAEIRERAARQLELIRQLVGDERTDEAVEACRRMVETFPADMGGNEARKILGRLLTGKPVAVDEKPGDVPDEIDRIAREDAARKLLDAGMVHEWDKRFLEAVETYRRLKERYPDTAAGKEGDKRLVQLLEDAQVAKALEEQKAERFCRRRLELAQLYEENGFTAQAVKYCEEVIAAYPQTAWAGEARRRIGEMTKKPGG